jgi:hypothetical protein
MSKLQKLGVLSTKRTQFTILNLAKLKELASVVE